MNDSCHKHYYLDYLRLDEEKTNDGYRDTTKKCLSELQNTKNVYFNFNKNNMYPRQTNKLFKIQLKHQPSLDQCRPVMSAHLHGNTALNRTGLWGNPRLKLPCPAGRPHMRNREQVKFMTQLWGFHFHNII